VAYSEIHGDPATSPRFTRGCSRPRHGHSRDNRSSRDQDHRWCSFPASRDIPGNPAPAAAIVARSLYRGEKRKRPARFIASSDTVRQNADYIMDNSARTSVILCPISMLSRPLTLPGILISIARLHRGL